MKKIILVVVFISFIFGLAACNREVDFELESPANVTITDGVVSWDGVDQADSYIVFIDTTEVEVQTTSYDLNDQNLAVGSYSITVVAVKDDKLSVPSAVLTFVVEDSTSNLGAPANVQIAAGILTWDSVSGATSYIVHVGAQSFTVTTESIDLNDESIAVGNYSVYVVASDGTNLSSNSSNVVYVVTQSVEQNVITLAVVQRMNNTYTLDLEETDFDEVDDYYDYLSALEMAEAFSKSTLSMGMTTTTAINLLNDATDMVEGMSDVMSLDGMMTELEIFEEYEIEAVDLANILYELVHVMLNTRIRDIDLSSMYREEQLTVFEGQIASIQEDPAFIAAYNYVKTFADASEYDALDMLFSGQHYELIEIVMDLSSGYTVYPENYAYLSPEMQGYIIDLISIVDSMNADTQGALFLENIYTLQDNFYTLEMYQSIIRDFEKYDSSNLEEILMYEELINAFSDNKEDVIDSLEVVIEFALTVKNTIPQNAIDLIDDAMSGEELTMTEMFTIKDELVLVLQNALPEATDFETIYTTLFIIGGSALYYDMTDYMDYAELLGQAQYLSMDLMLSLVADIDEDLIDDAMLILADAEDEYGYNFEQNPEVAIDFVLFVVNYLDAFMLDNATQINALEALITDEYIEEVYVMLLDVFIDQIENDEYIDPAEAEMLTNFLEDMKLEFDTYKALIDIFGDTATDVLSYMIDSEAALIKTIISMGQSQTPNIANDLMDIMTIVGEINNIDIEIFDEVDAAQLQVLFDAARLPLKTILEASEVDIDFDTLYPILTPNLSTLILNLISLQSDLFAEADALSYLEVLPMVTNTYLTSPEMGAYMVVIEIASNTLTIENETLIFDTIDVLFDDILSNEDVLALTEMTQLFVDDIKVSVVDEFQYVIDEFQALGLLEYDDLTLADEERINDFFLEIAGYLPSQEVYIR
jgi:hypothetical protein